MTNDEFRSLVRELRKLQKTFFATKDMHLLKECKRLEREVDAELKKQPGEQELFQ